VASRYGLDPGATTESLLDFEARGWVRQLSFAGSSGWSLTEAGQIDHTDWRWDDRDSCHLVWLQFHEDLLATLGISRGSELTPLEDA
jgi:hypothetical protein